MYIINKHELEIKENESLKNFGTIVEKYLMQNKKEDDVLNYFDHAYSK